MPAIDLSIETGCEFKITSSDMDMCKENTVQILPDLSGSPTDCVQITNCRIGNCQKTGIVVNAKDVKIANTQMFSTSLAGRSKYPVIELGPNAIDVSISDVRAEEHIGGRLASYAVSLAAGATNIQIDNLNANYVNRAAVENKGAAKLMIGKLIEPGSANPAGVYDDGAASGYFAKDYPGQTRFVSKNWATGAVGASIGASTGSRQAYLEIAMNDNSGRPFASYRYGNAVTTAYEKIPERVFQSASGAERVRIGDAGLAVNVPYVDHATRFVTPIQGGTVVATATTSRVVMTPGAAITSQAVEMPPSPTNGQLFYVSAVKYLVSGIRWPGNVVGAPGSMEAAHTVVLQFNAATGQWLCVQQ